MSESTTDVAAAPAQEGVELTRVTPAFKLVFLTVLGLTVIAFATNVILVIALKEPNEQAKTLIDTCSTITKAGFGAIVGLIGGKAV
ncbi:MAG TPA: hypothetical protein VGP16_26750 [Asanoa sp.]|jgi:hypothetical protein|nr:hypothetical protein [Asanoa sp.]